jgi:hypothetical protein
MYEHRELRAMGCGTSFSAMATIAETTMVVGWIIAIAAPYMNPICADHVTGYSVAIGCRRLPALSSLARLAEGLLELHFSPVGSTFASVRLHLTDEKLKFSQEILVGLHRGLLMRYRFIQYRLPFWKKTVAFLVYLMSARECAGISSINIRSANIKK